MIGMELVGTFDGTGTATESLFTICTNGNYVFAGSDTGDLWILDKTDPTNMVLMSYTPAANFVDTEINNINSLAISADGNTLYMATAEIDSGNAVLYLIDVTNKAAPVLTPTGVLNFSNLESAAISWQPNSLILQDAATLLCLVINTDTGQTIVYAVDVSGPEILPLENPITSAGACTEVFAFFAESGTTLSILVGFPADNTAELRTYSMADPGNPAALGTSAAIGPFLNVYESAGTFSVTSSNAYFLGPFSSDDGENFQEELYIWSLSNPASPSLVSTTDSTLTTDFNVRQSAITGDALIVVQAISEEAPTSLFSVQDSNNPVLVVSTPPSGTSVVIAGDYFFTTGVENSRVYAWLLSDIQPVSGWAYGDNNVIYS